MKKKGSFVLLLLISFIFALCSEVHANWSCNTCNCDNKHKHTCNNCNYRCRHHRPFVCCHSCNGCNYCCYRRPFVCYTHRTYGKESKEIKLLEKRKTESMAVKSKTCAVKVLNAEFYKQYTSDTLPISTAKLTIKNESTCTITKIYCKGKLTTHNTNTVLIEDSFSFDLASSLAPGEQNIYDIPLNSFGGWAKVFPPDLSVFCVVIDGIETTDGKAFVSSFSSKDQKRLDKLKKKYT